MSIPFLSSFQRKPAAIMLCFLAAGPMASGALLIQASEGAIRYDQSTAPLDDDHSFAGAYVFWDNPFFNGTVDAPVVSINGFIRFSSGDGNGDYTLTPLGTGSITRIAPMWHDFQIGSGSQIIEHADPDFKFYGVTWNNMESALHLGYTATFQALFFEETTVLMGNTFLKGDIAFSYGEIGFYQVSMDSVIGIEDGSDYATLGEFEPTAGAASFVNYGEFPVGENEFILFRPNGSGGYDVSIQPIPEPATSALGLLAALTLLRRKRRL
jgi:hypothetical protein